jgi:hypothetical protein
MVQQADERQQRIYALAFHVDYWNYLGWEDFSDRRYSQRQTADTIIVAFDVSKVPEPCRLHRALVERGITRRILGGENTGAHLRLGNVVRAFRSIDLTTKNPKNIALPVPASVVRHRAAIIGYVQHPKTMRILGATAIDL